MYSVCVDLANNQAKSTAINCNLCYLRKFVMGSDIKTSYSHMKMSLTQP